MVSRLPLDEWEEPTRNDSTHDTAPHDLTAAARAAAAIDTATVFNEGVEEAIRAFYVVMRKKRLTQREMDNIVLAVRGEITRL